MILFHGSTTVVKTPKLIDSQRMLDFGKGFYTTTNEKQAERWAILKTKRFNENPTPIVSKYVIEDLTLFREDLRVKKFDIADEEWLDFVYANRLGEGQSNYDIVMGPVANDTLYATLTLYETGLLSKNETIARLKSHKLFDQISFHSTIGLSEIQFVDYYECR